MKMFLLDLFVKNQKLKKKANFGLKQGCQYTAHSL